MKSKNLDKFYTKHDTAKLCWDIFKYYIPSEIDTVVEPSAGNGRMLDVIDDEYKKIGFDIHPERSDIIQTDFINNALNIDYDCVIFGNPPFGKRSKLAIEFLNRSLLHSNLVGMILPIQFKKWGTQKQIYSSVNLIHETILPPDSFTLDGKDYSVRCVFQIWSAYNTHENLRITKKPPTTHSDFELWQYNCTEKALKYFNMDWDIAILRQGYDDFNKIYYPVDSELLSRKKQWMFIKAKNDEVLNRIKQMDFNKIAELNTSTKGFGKADFIQYYGE
jgi:hypothetical protein